MKLFLHRFHLVDQIIDIPNKAGRAYKLCFGKGAIVLLAAGAGTGSGGEQVHHSSVLMLCIIKGLDTKGEEINIKDGVMEEVGNDDDGLPLGQERVTSLPDHFELVPTLKSNLKKTTTDEEENQLEAQRRKVRPDDHVKEFEPR
ncbi:hypothetical protein HRI_003852000 [Hibiscus trionum]|uniref:Uncharacterized protein n=1 Tax=Hibiscus trionum TaxID=183268 RepID=A0A9W7IVS4_HIBTR|nr:hypothetical protein HRI_003852000 [Hibiscus trionum]